MNRATSSQKAAHMADLNHAQFLAPVSSTHNRQRTPSRALNTDDSDSDSTPKASNIPLPPSLVKSSSTGNTAHKDLVCVATSLFPALLIRTRVLFGHRELWHLFMEEIMIPLPLKPVLKPILARRMFHLSKNPSRPRKEAPFMIPLNFLSLVNLSRH